MLWLMGVLCLVASVVTAESQTCMSDLAGGNFIIRASSATVGNPASDVFTNGWCASSSTKDQWIEIEFPSALGLKGFVVGPKDSPPTSFPKDVLVQYVPIGNRNLQDFPVQGGLVIHMDRASESIQTFSAGISTLKLRFFLRDYQTDPCLKIGLKGCPLNELCSTCVHGLCVQENNCQCNQGYTGDGCDKKVCSPSPLGLADGRLSTDKVTVSSEAVGHTKDDVTFATDKTGWCPAATDTSPWVQVKLDKPMMISVLSFKYPDRVYPEDRMFMRSFDLLYVAPQDSSRMVRLFLENIQSLNGTHSISVSMVPPISTDTLVIKARASENRACFKLELQGCDPEYMCSLNYCKNGGQCIGDNICSCPNGWIGDRCEQKPADIQVINTAFLQIVQNILITTSFNFTVTGHVTLTTEGNVPVVFLNGMGSFIQVNPASLAIDCLKDINICTSGFTYAIDVKFNKLVDNTYILSSGGDLPDHHGIALFYSQHQLTYIVTTTTFKWTLRVPYVPVLNTWQHIEITWNKNLGIELHLGGYLLGTVGRPDAVTAPHSASLCIGCSHGQVQVDISMLIKEFHTWTTDRTTLVNAGIKPPEALSTTLSPTTTMSAPSSTTAPTSTAAPTSTPHTAQTPTTTPAPTTALESTLTTRSKTTTFPTITLAPIPTFAWNFTQSVGVNITKHGNFSTQDGLSFTDSTQFIDFGINNLICLINPASCKDGLTIQFVIHFTRIEENTYLLTSGDQLPDGIGLSVIYRFNNFQFVVSTATQSWFASVHRKEVPLNKPHTITIYWHVMFGLEVFINNVLIDANKNPTDHVTTSVSVNTVYFGKQTSVVTTATNTKVDFVLQSITVWYARLAILVDRGIIKPPNRPIQPTESLLTQLLCAGKNF